MIGAKVANLLFLKTNEIKKVGDLVRRLATF